ncbi:MAG: galactose-1-epimerase, partial [Bacteroidia bacterium]
MITVKTFGKLKQGEEVLLYTLTNPNGMIAQITNYGGILCSLKVPVKEQLREVVLGFDNLSEYTNSDYRNCNPYFGAVIGRFANRINKGIFFLNEKPIQLACNNEGNHLHGGNFGFDAKIWDVEIIDENQLQLTYFSINGEENFPGNLTVKVTYTLTDSNELQIDYNAVTDQATPINLTNHSYFNLSATETDILNHQLQVNAATILNMQKMIPDGTQIPVKGTCFDFTVPKTIRTDIDAIGNYDNCYVVNNEKNTKQVTQLFSPEKDLKMQVFTNYPGLQVYTGQYINAGKEKHFGSFSGIALETQLFPDAPNHKEWQQGWLLPEEVYSYRTTY